MSVEAYSPFERVTDSEEKIQGVEAAARAIVRLRTLIADIERRLGLETTEATTVDPAMVEHLEARLRELTEQLEDALAFLEEFDPFLYQRLKDIS